MVEHRLANMNCQYYNLTEKTINKVCNILNNKIALPEGLWTHSSAFYQVKFP